ncbi:MAG: mechanosensitive ion channel family protein [Anaerolineae bacterium]
MFEQIQEFLFHSELNSTRILLSATVIFVLFVLRRLLMRTIIQRVDNPDQVYTWRKGTEYIFLFLGVISIAGIWIDGFSNMGTYLGLLSAGVAISLQDSLSNLVGWIFIIARHPFEVGDRIEVNGVAGDVIDIQLFKFSLLEIGNWVDADQSTGRVIHVPNRFIFTHSLANYTSGVPHIWNEIPIPMTFESDWQRAKKLLQEIADRHSLRPTAEEEAVIKAAAKRNNVKVPTMTPVVYTKVSASGVVLTLRYLCKPRRRRNSEQSIWEEVLVLFSQEKELDFAYPTQRVFYHPVEGKTLLSDHSEVAEPRNHLINDLR